MTVTQKTMLLKRHRGLFKRVAEFLRVNPSLVSNVYWKRSVSQRVLLALEREVADSRERAKAAENGERKIS